MEVRGGKWEVCLRARARARAGYMLDFLHRDSFEKGVKWVKVESRARLPFFLFVIRASKSFQAPLVPETFWLLFFLFFFLP